MSDPFDSEVKVWMIVMVVAPATSALAAGGLLLYIAYSTVTIKPNSSRRWSTETHVHYYFLNLMISDLIASLGELLTIKWIVEARVYPGTFCTLQGLFMHVGDLGVSLSTMAIALHILRVLVLEWIFPPKFAPRILAIIWLVIAILVVVPNVVQNNIYGPTSHWCWIDRGIMQQIGLDYMWMWLTAVLNIISYLLLALVIKRLVVVDRYKLHWGGKQERGIIAHGGGTSPESVRATQMLFYPLLYVVLVLPLSAARFSQIRGDNVPFSVTASSAALFALSGLFNTILYAFTRPRLIPGRASRNLEGAHVTIAGMAHDRFRHGYVAGDDSFVMTTGLNTVP